MKCAIFYKKLDFLLVPYFLNHFEPQVSYKLFLSINNILKLCPVNVSVRFVR